jgi:hypothetical protein
MHTTAQSQFQKNQEHVAHDFPVDEDPDHHTILPFVFIFDVSPLRM